MFGKLVYGKFPLGETFWKFGVFGLFSLALITKICKSFLFQKLKGMSLGFYYTHHFSLLNMDNGVLIHTVLYLFFAGLLCIYSLMIVFGVWRSADEYDKSIWIRRIAKVMILFVIYCSLEFGL